MKIIFVIARATLAGLARDRIFHAAMVINILLLAFASFLSTLTIVEERKLLLDFGFAAASLVGVVFSIVLGSSFVRKELDSRTIYTVLAKPVGRAQYLVGKIFGGCVVIIILNALSFLALSLALWMQGAGLPAGFISVFYFSVLEGTLLLVTSMAISLPFSSLFLGCALSLAVFIIGRNAYTLEAAAQKTSGLAFTILKIVYILFPALHRFDVRDSVAYGRAYPGEILLESSVYFAAYSALVTVLAVLYFRRKDLP